MSESMTTLDTIAPPTVRKVPVPMTTSRRSPTLRRRRLSDELRRLREEAGLTAAEVCKQCGWATGTLTKWERRDWQRPSLSNIRTLIDLYGVTDELKRAELEMLAVEGKERSGWWHAYRAMMSPAYSTYVGLEAGAAELLAFNALIVPGLLQTEAYARSIVEAGPDELDEKQIDRLVQIRAERQALLTRADDPLRLWVVLDEAALRRQVGGAEVMREQLLFLLDMARLAKVTIQITPFAAGAHPGVTGPFTIMMFPEPEDLPAVHIDSPGGQLFVEEPEEVRRFEIALQRIQAMALPPADSLRLIAELAES
jgi:transcriptional regulator with XRE-family HTH domain